MLSLKSSLLILIFLSSNIFSQEFWNPSNGPFGQGTADIIFGQDNEIYCTGIQGIFYSSDGGSNWEWRWVDTLYYLAPGVTSLAIKGNFLFAGTHYGLFRSSDDGLSWELVKSGGVIKIIVHPITGDIFAAEFYGVFYSSDDGLTWMDITNNLPSSQIWEMGIIQTGEIFIGFDFDGLYKTTNYGQEWFRSDTGMTDSGVSAFTQSTDGTIYAGRRGIFKSTDNGSNWTNIYFDSYGQLFSLETYQDSIVYAGLPQYLLKSTNYGSDWDTSFQAFENNNFINLIKVNNLGEVFTSVGFWGLIKSTDCGSTWERIGLPSASIHDMALSPNTTIFSNAYMAGLFRSTNNGDSWEWIDHFGGDLIVDDSGYVYCLGDKLYRSFDNGLTWVSNYLGVNMYKLFLSKNNKLFLANIDVKLYSSTDFGSTWVLINSNFPSLQDYAIDSFGNIYIVNSYGIYKSEDEGVSWNQININFGLGESVIDIDDNDKIYVGSETGIHFSSDNGSTWYECNTGLQNTYTTSIAINNDNVVYASFINEGVYYYDSINNRWNSVDDNPYYKFVSVLLFDDEGYLYAGTQSHSVIKSRETTVTIDEDLNLQLDYLLSQNYPNPFNPTTTIKFEIAERGFVTIRVYDVLGSEVATLVNEEKPSGKYEVEFVGTGLTSGIYFYQIKAGNFVQTKKMILLK
jgi:photosystem II stability/assembly factor-like uncharacterized protein